MNAHPRVQMRHIVKQTTGNMSGLSELNFDGDFTWAAQLQGRQDAIDALKQLKGQNGSGGVAGYIREWLHSDEVRKEYSQVGDYINERQAEERVTRIFEEKIMLAGLF